MTSNHPQEFDLAAKDLNYGRVVIQASAGTGKTYSLTVLAIRHIAEQGLSADQLLIVSFTNAATAELRERVREQAKETLHNLKAKDQKQPWMASMFASESSRHKAESNLEKFLTHFDQATISTIHGFCQIVLRQIGLNSPAPKNYTVQSNINEIINQVITDHLVSQLAAQPQSLPGTQNKTTAVDTSEGIRKSLAQLRKAVDRAISNPKAILIPAEPPSKWATDVDSLKEGKNKGYTQRAIEVTRLVRSIIAEVHRRCFDAGIITYDDMVRLVAEFFDSENEPSKVLAASLAGQYKLMMVDEFQDTDAAQWSIFSRIYEAKPYETTLITVGDPKQAIYRFRGADVQVYLNAIKGVEQSFEITTNYRSDERLLIALQTLLLNRVFAERRAAKFTKVKPAEKNKPGTVTTESNNPPANVPGAPLELRYLSNNEKFLDAKPGESKPGTPPWKSHNSGYKVDRIVFRDVANHIVELLQHGCIPDKDSDFPYSPKPICPNDIAVLVNGHADAEAVVRYLNDAEVPAVRYKTDSVFQSQAALHCLMLLGALANPGKPTFVRAYALSWFGNTTTEELAAATDDVVAEWQRNCAEKAELLRTRGISALFLSYRNSSVFLQRVLKQQDGERNITDLDHVVEILASTPHLIQKAGAGEFYETLLELVEGSDESTDEFQRRIEGDKVAVKVMTIHSSKGLQFPIVFLPTLFNKPPNNNNNPKMFSYQLPLEPSPTRVINVASGFESASDWVSTADADFDHKKRDKLFKDDVLFDSKRLLYVALTRAEHKVVLYWSAVGQGGESANTNTALAEFLVSHLAGNMSEVSLGDEKPKTPKLTIPVDQEPLSALMDSIATSSNGTISASHLPIQPDAPLTWSPTIEKADAQTSTAQYSRAEPLSTFGYSRWSYSQLSRLLSDEQDDQVTADLKGSTDESNLTAEKPNSSTEKPTATKEIAISKEVAISSMPLYAIGGSNIFGNAVHEIIDSIDPASPDLLVNLEIEVERHFKHSHSNDARKEIINGIVKSLHAPLGEPFAGNTLTTLGAAHRLSELEFNFHLPQSSIGAFSPNKIGELMLEHGQLNGLLFDYAQAIASSKYSSVIAGFMNGSIDAVFRVNAGSNPLYIVSDYKTDRLYDTEKSGANPLVAYHPDNLVAHMVDSGYILQAMVYSVALHRYLQWRQPGYDPDIHLGGTAYLFLRGMTGFNTDEATPRPFGVYHWKPTTALILALDALFAGRNN